MLTDAPLEPVQFAIPGPRPSRLSEMGVRESTLEDIALKALYLYGPFSLLDLAEKMCIGFEVANEIFNRMRGKLLCEVTGMSVNVPNLAITSQGRSRALELLAQSQYSGAAPVSLASYVEMVQRQSVRNLLVGPKDVEKAFSHMVFEPKTLAQFGTALNSGAPIFCTALRALARRRQQKRCQKWWLPMKSGYRTPLKWTVR